MIDDISIADAVIGLIVFFTGLLVLPLACIWVATTLAIRAGVRRAAPVIVYGAAAVGVVLAALAAFEAMALEDYRPGGAPPAYARP
ncbi:MAG: hypothetical protein IT562_10680 [Alphaproteobacteria bacterium]|nr:hypothetical protein [Alphaproteobacteria bacterium]